MASNTATYEAVQAAFAAVEAGIRAAREALQRVQDTAGARYGTDANLVVLAVGEASRALQEMEEGPLLHLQEELGQTEVEAQRFALFRREEMAAGEEYAR